MNTIFGFDALFAPLTASTSTTTSATAGLHGMILTRGTLPFRFLATGATRSHEVNFGWRAEESVMSNIKKLLVILLVPGDVKRSSYSLKVARS